MQQQRVGEDRQHKFRGLFASRAQQKLQALRKVNKGYNKGGMLHIKLEVFKEQASQRLFFLLAY